MQRKNGYSRRDFLKIVGATGGLAAAGCSERLPEKIIPYVIAPDDIVPGVAVWYAGACSQCSSGCGVLVRTREGRAVKIEGNPDHPINKGTLCAQGHASLQVHYDPDRVREPLKRSDQGAFITEPAGWEKGWQGGIDALAKAVSGMKPEQQVVLLTHPATGSLKALISEFQAKVPKLLHVEYGFHNSDALDVAAEKVYGKGTRTHFDFSKAKTIVSFGADFLETWDSPVEYSRQWSTNRTAESMSYVVHVEPRCSLTAANADRWIQNAPGSEAVILLSLLKAINEQTGGRNLSSAGQKSVADLIAQIDPAALKRSEVSQDAITELATRLVGGGPSLVVAGGAAVGENALLAAVAANLINSALGNVGTTVQLVKREGEAAFGYQKLRDVMKLMDAGQVGVLIIAGPNPAYALPPALRFESSLAKVSLVVSLSSKLDETASLAHWVLPASTAFECWDDAEPLPGVFNLNQPSMQPLYKTQAIGDTLLALGTKLDVKFGGAQSYYDFIRLQWKKRIGESGFEDTWLDVVQHGGQWSSPRPSASAEIVMAGPALQLSPDQPGLTLIAFPSVNSSDGSVANSPWMQELPNPLTSAVWGSWIEIHPETAAQYDLRAGRVARIKTKFGSVEAPVYITERIHRNALAIPLGQGHTRFGRFANGIGANAAFALNPESTGDLSRTVLIQTIERSAWDESLVMLEGSDSQEKRALIRTIGLSEIAARTNSHGAGADAAHAHKAGAAEHEEHEPGGVGPRPAPRQMYQQMDHPLYRWGMTIDLNRCTGCSACVVACYAENNIPVVGKRICDQGREMSWIRIDRYFDGPKDRPVSGFQPMLCQHCNNAPCEPVCPVYATYHNEEGLNVMVYNRCVGTRYCSNNCSYKVRRFNWFKYDWPEPLNWQLNPDVTVREVGIMEKCSFCTQRIREGENRAKNLGRPVKDGEIQPACAATCPTNAITFGNLLDKKSRVHELWESERGYRVLDEEINTQPAVTYLARIEHDRQKTGTVESHGSPSEKL